MFFFPILRLFYLMYLLLSILVTFLLYSFLSRSASTTELPRQGSMKVYLMFLFTLAGVSVVKKKKRY